VKELNLQETDLQELLPYLDVSAYRIGKIFITEAKELIKQLNENVEDGNFENLKDVQSFADFNTKDELDQDVVIFCNEGSFQPIDVAYIIKK